MSGRTARASAQTTMCLYFHSNGADARTVCPYTAIMTILSRNTIETKRQIKTGRQWGKPIDEPVSFNL